MIRVPRASAGDGSGREERIISGTGLDGFLVILTGETVSTNGVLSKWRRTPPYRC